MNAKPLSMAIGPTRLTDDVKQVLGQQPPPLDDTDYLAAYAECLRSLRPLAGLRAPGQAIVMPGTGTAALESALISTVPPGARIAVVSTGWWGDRAAAIGHAHGYDVHVRRAEPGCAVPADEVEALLSQARFGALLVTHSDSSSGVLTDPASMAALARRTGTSTIVDGISALGADAVDLERAGIDVYITGSGKALSCAPGLGIVLLSGSACSRLERREWHCPSFALDLKPWLGHMRTAEAGEYSYHQTPAVGLVSALAVSLRRILRQSVDARLRSQRQLGYDLRERLADQGVELFVKDPAARAAGITVCHVPSAAPEFLERVRHNGVALARGVYPGLEKETFRIGHLGNVTAADVDRTVAAVASAQAE